jgi:simple sugar transport system ATP-binding protein
VDPYALVADLPVAAQQRVEIVKAIANDAPVLMLDEPTAVLSPLEAAELMRWLRGFVQSGRTVIVITHRIREALQYADAVTVLRSGRTVLAAAMPDTDEHTVLASLLGEAPIRQPPDASPGTPSSPTEPGQAVLVLRDMTVIGESGVRRVAPTSLSVHAGEIVGVAGVDGGGQRELLRVLAGRQAPSAGSVQLPDSIGFVPEDRLRDAIIPGLSLVDNLALRGAGSRHGRLRWPDLSAATRSAIRDFDVLVADQQGAISNLSGGNQQKFVLARELAGSPRALIVENPTRGLDVRASRDILGRLRAIRAAGTAVVVYSSDIEELLSIADRIVVCFAGVVRETALDADVIGRAMVGAA